jgi:hypothetical protein
MSRTYPQLLFLALLAALPLWIFVPGNGQAAAPNPLQEALGAPPPSDVAPPPGKDPFKEPLKPSAPFIDISEEPMRPPGKWGDPPGFKSLPMTGPQGPSGPRAPQVPAPEFSGPKRALAAPTRNSTAKKP